MDIAYDVKIKLKNLTEWDLKLLLAEWDLKLLTVVIDEDRYNHEKSIQIKKKYHKWDR